MFLNQLLLPHLIVRLQPLLGQHRECFLWQNQGVSGGLCFVALLRHLSNPQHYRKHVSGTPPSPAAPAKTSKSVYSLPSGLTNTSNGLMRHRPTVVYSCSAYNNRKQRLHLPNRLSRIHPICALVKAAAFHRCSGSVGSFILLTALSSEYASFRFYGIVTCVTQ